MLPVYTPPTCERCGRIFNASTALLQHLKTCQKAKRANNDPDQSSMKYPRWNSILNLDEPAESSQQDFAVDLGEDDASATQNPQYRSYICPISGYIGPKIIFDINRRLEIEKRKQAFYFIYFHSFLI